MRLHKQQNIIINQELGKISLSNFLNITSNKTNKDKILIKINPIIQNLEQRGIF